jgi:multiple sugar transport system permease protein
MGTSGINRFARIKGSLMDRNDNWYLYLLVLPVILALVVFLWYPLLQGVWISFHYWPLLGDHTWVGLQNYISFISSEVFVTSLIMTFFMAVASVPQLLIGLGAALAIFHTERLKNVLSTTFLVPFILPPLASGTIIYFFLSPGFGPIQPALMELGIIDSPIFWRISALPARIVVVGSLIWTYWPWAFIIFLAKRQSIPVELYESAKMYGASRWQMFRHITLPHMRGVLLFVIVFRIVNNITKVEQNFQLTRGGPGYSTSPLSLVLYQFTRKQSQMGQAIAVGVLMLIIGLALALPLIWFYERSTQETNPEGGLA